MEKELYNEKNVLVEKKFTVVLIWLTVVPNVPPAHWFVDAGHAVVHRDVSRRGPGHEEKHWTQYYVWQILRVVSVTTVRENSCCQSGSLMIKGESTFTLGAIWPPCQK